MGQSFKHIMLIAGEASGDRHAANLMKSLKIRRGSDIRFTGLGGQLMREEGQEQLYDIKELAVLGLTEVLKRIFFFKKVFEETLDFIENEKPDALVLVDYPGFNVRLAERLARTRKSGRGKIIYYISPQVWAWGKGRVEKIGRAIDRMLVIFPFEEQIYASKLIPVSFVGHPLLDELKDIPQKNEARKKIGLSEQEAVIGILPGSRRQEIGLILPIMLKAAQLLKNKFNAKFLIPLAPGVDRPVVENGLMKQGLRQDYKAGIFKIVEGETPAAISASDLIITASGTATLETAILERPMVIVYKVPFLTYLVLRRIIKLDSIGMVNILLNEKAFPEFIQYNARPDEIFKACSRILEENDLRENMLCNLKKVKSLLGTPGAGINAANQIWGMIDE